MIALATSLSAIAQTTWFVDAGAVPPGLGTPAQPFVSIQNAVNAAASGDTILVGAGAYSESIDDLGKSLAIEGEGAGRTEVSQGGDVLRLSGHFARVSDVSLVGSLRIVGNGAVVDSCVLPNPTGTAVWAEFGASATLRGAVIHDSSVALRLRSAAITLANCAFAENNTDIFSSWTTFANPSHGALSAWNTIFTSSIQHSASGFPPVAIFAHCCFGGTLPAFGPLVGGVVADPRFVDPTGGDFRILPSSPCLDAGTNLAPVMPVLDIDGEPRIAQGAIDIGVDELHGPALDACGSGTGLDDYLLINGETGGSTRRVEVMVGQPLTFDVLQPPSNPLSAPFAVFGFIGAPMLGDATVLPFNVGEMCFAPSELVPSNQALFFLASSYAPGSTIFPFANPAPWSETIPLGIPIPFTVTFQGVISETPASLAITNGIIVQAR